MLTSRAVAAGAARAARVEAYGASSRAGRTPRFAGGGGSGGRLAFVRQRGASITLRAGGDGHGHSHSHGHPLHQAPVEEACCSADDCAASVSKQHSHIDDKPYSPLEGCVSPHPFAWNEPVPDSRQGHPGRSDTHRRGGGTSEERRREAAESKTYAWPPSREERVNGLAGVSARPAGYPTRGFPPATEKARLVGGAHGWAQVEGRQRTPLYPTPPPRGSW